MIEAAPPIESHAIPVADGRVVGFATWGEGPADVAIVHCHGTPGSRVPSWPSPPGPVRHVALDRPGYGLSDPLPGRVVADHAADVAAVLDHLGVSRCSAFGWSGGGPHALALGAVLGDRVARVATVGCGGPFGGDFDYMEGLAEINRRGIEQLLEDPEADRQECEETVAAFREDPAGLVRVIAENVAPVDAAIAQDPVRQAMVIGQLRAGFLKGAEGWVEDDLLIVKPWGFELGAVTSEVWLVHGQEDRLVPIAHGRYLASRLPRCRAQLMPGEGHISPMLRFGEYLAWLAEPLV